MRLIPANRRDAGEGGLHDEVERLTSYLKNEFDVYVTIWDSDADVYTDAGRLSGKCIYVNLRRREGMATAFTIAHLFGHMVQFSNYERYRPMVEATERERPLALSARFRENFYAYEREAYEIGKGLFAYALGPQFAAEWDEAFQIYFQTDFDCYWRYLTSRESLSTMEFSALLAVNLKAWKGRFPFPLRTGELPDSVNPQHDVVVA